MSRLLIFGSSGHAKVVIDIIRQEGKHEVVGLVDPHRAVGEEVMGIPVLGKDADLEQLSNKHAVDAVLIAVGDNFVRSKIATRVIEACPKLKFISTIHPKASIASNARIGDGTVVMAGAVVGPEAEIGGHCILNTNCSIDHESTLSDFASLAPGATVGGNSHIGIGSAIGIGASIFQNITIGDHTLIGGGALVLSPIASLSVAYGVPARTVRSRSKGEPYT